MSSISKSLRRKVAERSQYRCSYCQTQLSIIGLSFTIDHIVPIKLGGSSDIDNLCLACWDCNIAKKARTTGLDSQTGEQIRLFHPNQQNWPEHFEWNENGTEINGLTPTGRATVLTLKLNRRRLVASRRRWVKVGWHPPQMD